METIQSADGTTIAFDRYGDGPALILVVGAFCDRSAPRPLAELLAPHFTVYAYDRRGRGSSTDTAPYSVDREIDDLGAVITAAGGSAMVFGHSSGAVLTLEAAARGMPITRLVAYEPPYIVGDSRPRPVGLAARTRELVTAGHRGEAIKLFFVEGLEVPAEAVTMTGPEWPALEALAHTLPYDLTICGDQWIPAGRMAKISVPAHILGGGDSPAWFQETVRAVAAAVPGARHTLLEGQTHGAADDVLAPALVELFADRGTSVG